MNSYILESPGKVMGLEEEAKNGKIAKKKKIIKLLEECLLDISRLRTDAEKCEKPQDMQLSKDESNFAAWDYKGKIARKERWVCYFLGKALELEMDKDNDVIPSIFPDRLVKCSEYIITRCQQYGIGKYSQQDAPSHPTEVIYIESAKQQQEGQQSSAAGA